MQCEYRDNASGRTTAAESIADAWSGAGRDVSYREVEEASWQPLTDWQPYRAGTAALYAPPAPSDAELDAYVPPDPVLEIDRDTMRRLGELADLAGGDERGAVATAVAAHHAAVCAGPGRTPAGSTPTADDDLASPTQPRETTAMRIAVKSPGGITECFLHAENADAAAQGAAKQIAADYGLPVDLELWSDPPDGAPRRLGELRFVAVDDAGTVLQLD